MTLVLLARHGRSTSNTAATLAGRTPGVALDPTGESQAMTLGERLRGIALDAAVRSPMLRCEQTLRLALDSAGLHPPVHVDDELTECDYGRWSNRPLAELAGEPLWREVQQRPSSVVFPGGESMQQMARRTVAAVERWNARLEQELSGREPVWLLVGHGDPLKAVLSHALGQALDDFQRLVVDPASVSIVRFPDEAGRGRGEVPTVLCTNSTEGALAARLGGAGPQLGGGLGSQSA